MAVTKAPIRINDLTFSCPKIGPKDYITVGPSGWPETFKRAIVDKRLVDFVKALAPTVEIDELVDMFIAMRELAEKPEPVDWFTVVGFLGRQLGVHPGAVPHECAIAFWGRVVLGGIAHDTN